MKRTMYLFLVCGLVIFMLGLGWLMLPKTAMAREGVLPQAVTITSADLSIYITSTSPTSASIHRVTEAWAEKSITWNTFNGKFDPTVVATFTPSSTGWVTANVTSLVQEWVNGTNPNYGFAITQGGPVFTYYRGSTYPVVSTRPRFKVCYSMPGGGNVCQTMQRQGNEGEGISDTFICTGLPNVNPAAYGFNFRSFGFDAAAGGTRQAFLRFDFTILKSKLMLPAVFYTFKTQ